MCHLNLLGIMFQPRWEKLIVGVLLANKLAMIFEEEAPCVNDKYFRYTFCRLYLFVFPFAFGLVNESWFWWGLISLSPLRFIYYTHPYRPPIATWILRVNVWILIGTSPHRICCLLSLSLIEYESICFPFIFNTVSPRQMAGHHFADDTFKRILLNENVKTLLKTSLNCVTRGPINNIPCLFGAKPLSEPMMVSLLTYICVTRP